MKDVIPIAKTTAKINKVKLKSNLFGTIEIACVISDALSNDLVPALSVDSVWGRFFPSKILDLSSGTNSLLSI